LNSETLNTLSTPNGKHWNALKIKKEVQGLKCSWKQMYPKSKHKKHNKNNKDEILHQNTKQKGGLKCLKFLEQNWNKFDHNFHWCTMDDNDDVSIPLNHPSC